MQSPKPYHEERPWGEFIEFTRNTPSTVKIISVKAGQSLSLQTHRNRDEFWRVLSGEGFVTIGKDLLPAKPGDEFFITKGTAHRMEAGPIEFTVLEISFGDFDENDIVRLEDRYGRI